jgi:flagellar hook-associated protein 3 FlgL
MIKGFGTISENFLANLDTLQQQMTVTQEQISSGKRINQASDDPGALPDVLQIEADLSRVNQVSQNLSNVTGSVNTAESALQNATTVLNQVTTLGEQGANSITTAAQRTALAQQVQQSLAQLVSISQTTFDGQYVFAGDNPTQAPYQINLSNANGVDQLNSAPSTVVIQDATGATFAVSQTAQYIFDDRNPDKSLATDNIFAAVNSLRIALANNDQAGVTTALGSLQLAQDHLSASLQFYGGVQSQLTNATSVAQQIQLQYQTSLSQETATNIASAAVDLSQEQASLQASIQAQGALPKTTLFDLIG